MRTVDQAQLEQKIRDFFGQSVKAVTFNYSEVDGKIRLNLMTENMRHHQTFLFHTTLGVDHCDALEKMLQYVREYRSNENSYTVQWTARGDEELHTSYFRANTMYEVLDKLYFDRETQHLTVFSIVLNPVS